jgi:choline dehydrogenase-like flavoprotein
MTEQIPNPDSRVSLSATHRDRHGYPAAKIDWQLTPDDIRAFHRYARLLLEQGLRSGQYELGRRDEAEVWDRTLASAAHHLGTCRMGHGPGSGVVDADLKVFGTNNLYICDGSVFTTAGSVNPSLTITALGLRLSAHLAGRSGINVVRAS